MSSGDKLNLARTSREASPMGSAHDRKTGSARRTRRISGLHIKGFAGGVPLNPFDKLRVSPERRATRGVEGLNTETAAVKPRVGIGANASSGDKSSPGKSNDVSSSGELNAAAAKMKVYKIERLAYTDAANAKPTAPTPAERRRALEKAIYYWVHSRL